MGTFTFCDLDDRIPVVVYCHPDRSSVTFVLSWWRQTLHLYCYWAWSGDQQRQYRSSLDVQNLRTWATKPGCPAHWGARCTRPYIWETTLRTIWSLLPHRSAAAVLCSYPALENSLWAVSQSWSLVITWNLTMHILRSMLVLLKGAGPNCVFKSLPGNSGLY